MPIEASSTLDMTETPKRYLVRSARHTCGKIAGVPITTPARPITVGEMNAKVTQNAPVATATSTGCQSGIAFLRTSITINAMMASSMLMFDRIIGTLSVVIAYVNHIGVPVRPMRCECGAIPSTLWRA